MRFPDEIASILVKGIDPQAALHLPEVRELVHDIRNKRFFKRRKQMPQCLENPEIHIWYVGGNSAVGHNILLEVDEKFYVADDMANEPMLVNM